MRPELGTVLRWIPLLLLSAAHLWLVERCLSGIGPPQPPAICSAPPLSTLGLLALAYIELTGGSRVRGAIALLVVAIPIVLGMVSEGIN